MAEEEELFQLVPPEIHRRNVAYRHIQTWKNHFISELSSCPKGFPINLWCYLVPQGYLILNLLQNSHINPKLSAQAYFNATPLAPMGKKCLLRENQVQEESGQLEL